MAEADRKSGPVAVVAILAHNEERRIAACIESLLGEAVSEIHVLVNGSTDRTAARARAAGGERVMVHEFTCGGKARSWNRFVFDMLGSPATCHVFVDGDARVVPGSVAALMSALDADPYARIASAVPRNGRSARAYQRQMVDEHGMFGDLYAIRGSFLARMAAAHIRLPVDLVGEDGLIGALAKTDLRDESHWDDRRVIVCPAAGFHCEPLNLLSPRTLGVQYRRMINYAVRHFQNRMISAIMRGPGPTALPERLADLYGEMLPAMRPRRSPTWWHFDRLALRRMRGAA